MTYYFEPSLTELKKQIKYNKRTGEFHWKVSGKTGNLVKLGKNGQVMFRNSFGAVVAKRLAWAFIHGTWPEGNVSVLDGDETNLRANNLDLTKNVKKGKPIGKQQVGVGQPTSPLMKNAAFLGLNVLQAERKLRGKE